MNSPNSEPKKSDHVVLRRVIVAVWGIPLLIGAILLGGWYFTFLIAAIAGLAMYEYLTMIQKMGAEVIRIPTAIAAGLFILVTHYNLFWGFDLGLICLVLLAIASLRGSAQQMAMRVAGPIAGFAYIAGLLNFLSLLRSGILTISVGNEMFPTHFETIWGGIFIVYLFASIWICDSCAYFGGKRFGKHPLAPAISPKKTIEGSIFGLVGTLLWSLVGMYVLGDKLPWLFLLSTAAVAGTVGQAGDLIESMIKRSAGVKDSGHFLPEHGGIFDRFDSLILTSPVVFLLAQWFGLLSI